ncbi:MAG: DUF4982 domain-containing protein, partial [Planctomycetales bacterium]|nr:DUF4982 domain-containing protein [Planctomycetales bacterium]
RGIGRLEREWRDVVLRDRNHPSIIAWSIGNELLADEEGLTKDRVAMMADVVRKYDATRPVGLGCHIPWLASTEIYAALDLTGWNYARRYDVYRRHYPDRPIVYTESASTVSTRGYYSLPLPFVKTDYAGIGQVDSYDLNAAPWADIPDVEFRLMQNDAFVAGEFVWTGFDYLGEPTPFEQEARSSYFGAVDLCGLPKDRYWLYRSQWRPSETTLHLAPHWNWNDRVGQIVPVFAYTNAPEAELFVNGRSLGRRRKGEPPAVPRDVARDGVWTASAAVDGAGPEAVADDALETRWQPPAEDESPWLKVDLGQSRTIGCVHVEFPAPGQNYGVTLETSDNGRDWSTLIVKPASDQPQWGGVNTIVCPASGRGRYLRLTLQEVRRNQPPGICEMRVYEQPVNAPYYDVTYDYRLRWDDVVYEPGELRCVAYKDGQRIAETTVRTAGAPQTLKLSADRVRLQATGDDLCYVCVEAVDAKGVPCPLADCRVAFRIEGPADLVATGNGDPLCLEPFTESTRRLFFGKAIAIVRTRRDYPGEVRVVADAPGLAGAETTLSVAEAE